jgi:hypothetical protein
MKGSIFVSTQLRHWILGANLVGLLVIVGLGMAAAAAKSADVAWPDDAAIHAFTGSAEIVFPGEGETNAVSLYDRLLDGFEVGPRQLALDGGGTIYWGQKFQEGNLQSVLVGDGQGRIRLIAIVDNVVSIARGNVSRINSLDQYRALVAKESGSDFAPMISIFIKDARDLDAYLPILKRWLQADLLGFTVQCDTSPQMVRACQLAEQIDLPMHAFLLSAGGSSVRALVIPAAVAKPIPLDAFRW